MANKLETAMDLFFQWQRADPQPARKDYLAAHPDYADYLEPLMADGVEPPEDDDAPEEEPQPQPTRTLGEYRLGRELGRGGMGIVYAAWQPSLDRHVALKVLSPQLTHDPATLVRFRREATTAAGLQHPGIAQVLEFGNVGETHFIAMQLVPGASLEDVIKGIDRASLPHASGEVIRDRIAHSHTEPGGAATDATSGPDTAAAMTWSGGYVQTVISIVIQIADTLEFAHSQGVIHRDIKPSNILIRPDGRAVLADFGLARHEGISSLSMTGDFAGSPFYVSPEQGARKSSELDRRTDLFSLGVTLYEALTLQRPFTGSTPHQVVESILRDEPPSPARYNPDLPGDLVAIVLKSIEKDRQRRYQTAAELAADLRAFLAYRPVTARHPTTWNRVGRWARREPLKVSLGGVLVVAAVLAVYVMSSREATLLGEAARHRQLVDDKLMEGWLAYRTPNQNKVAVQKFEEALKLDPGNARAIFGCIWFGDLHGEDATAFLDAHAVPGRDETAIARLRATRGAKANTETGSVGHLIPPEELSGLSAMESFSMGVIGLPLPGGSQSRERFLSCQRLFKSAIFSAREPRFEHFMILAHVASQLDDVDTSRMCANALMTHWPTEPMAMAAAGFALRYTDRPRALDLLEHAVAARPDLYFCHHYLARALAADGQYDRAVEAAQTAKKLVPEATEIDGLLGLFYCHLAMQRPADDPDREALLRRSLESCDRVLAVRPRDAFTIAQKATTLERLGEVDEAWRLIHEAARLHPTNEGCHRGVLGLARLRGDLAAQRTEAERWVEVNPNGPTAHREMAEFLLKHGEGQADLDLALKMIQRADRIVQGSDPFILVTLAEVLQRRGEPRFIPQILARAEQFMPPDGKEKDDLRDRIAALRAR